MGASQGMLDARIDEGLAMLRFLPGLHLQHRTSSVALVLLDRR